VVLLAYFLSRRGINAYILLIILITIGIFFSHLYAYSTIRVDWILFLAIAGGIIISDYYTIPKPPKGILAFSMDTALYIAALITFGIEVSLLLLFVSSGVFGIIRNLTKVQWWKHIFNSSIYSIMMTTSYYTYLKLGGEVGSVNLEQIASFLAALVSYFLVNFILLIPYYYLAASDQLMTVIKGFLKETLAIYLITLASSYILIILFNDKHPIFGLFIFIFIIILLSVVFKNNLRLFEEISKDKVFREQILNSLPVGVITIDDASSKLDLNTEAASLLNMNASEVNQLLNVNGELRQDETFWRNISSKEKYKNVKAEYDVEDKKHLLLMSQSELIDQYEQLIGRIIYFIDITDTDELEKRIYQSEKLALLGELAAGAAHEIRNPLAVIQGFLTLMNESLEDVDKDNFHIPLLLKEFKRIDSIVDEMLLIAKPGAPMLKEVYLEDIVEEILPLFDSNETDQEITFKLDIERTRLLLDSKQITQVFYNLIRNSCEAIGDKGWISISSKIQNGLYQLFIQDSGQGISSEIQQRLFDPFQTTKESGTGLGLTIVQRIIENHNGKIELISNEGEGSLFLISLPIVETKQ
jgi:signal transduction histidine kinase